MGGDGSTYLVGGLRSWVPLSDGSFSGLVRGGLATTSDRGNWGSAALDLHARGGERRGWGWALQLRGLAFAVGSPNPYRAGRLEALPELSRGLGPVTLALQGYGGVGRSEIGSGEERFRLDLHAWGGALKAEASMMDWTVRGRAARVDGEVGGYWSGSLGGERSLGEGVLSARVALWEPPSGDPEWTGEVALRMPIGAAVGAVGAIGRSDPDPLLGIPAGGFASAALEWRLSDPAPAPEPLPVRVLDPPTGRVLFRVARESATAVAVAGDFSDWRPRPLQPVEGGWAVEMNVEPGFHRYAFLVDGEWWVPEDAPGRSTDEWGRPAASFFVPAPGGGEAPDVTPRGANPSTGQEGPETRSARTRRGPEEGR